MSLNFDKKQEINKIGRFLGFLFSYFIFTTILYLILNILNKLPQGVGYFHIYLLTAYIVSIGILMRKIIK